MSGGNLKCILLAMDHQEWPNAGKMFRVPTIPTHCPKGSPKAISWMVNVFHSFKAHLQPSVLINGNIPTPILHTYQSNMVLHLRMQLRLHSTQKSTNVLLQQDAPTPTQILEMTVLCSPSHPSPPTPTPTQTPTTSTKSDLDVMMALYASAISQIKALKKEIPSPLPHSGPQPIPSPSPLDWHPPLSTHPAHSPPGELELKASLVHLDPPTPQADMPTNIFFTCSI
ncbi:hypothetical protein BU15DRAFT_72927 [Melanogaster broomeanus]|nr:hypothetical protein BU15DRAFT_72927 [Melanogaster broomeanus]